MKDEKLTFLMKLHNLFKDYNAEISFIEGDSHLGIDSKTVAYVGHEEILLSRGPHDFDVDSGMLMSAIEKLSRQRCDVIVEAFEKELGIKVGG